MYLITKMEIFQYEHKFCVEYEHKLNSEHYRGWWVGLHEGRVLTGEVGHHTLYSPLLAWTDRTINQQPASWIFYLLDSKEDTDKEYNLNGPHGVGHPDTRIYVYCIPI